MSHIKQNFFFFSVNFSTTFVGTRVVLFGNCCKVFYHMTNMTGDFTDSYCAQNLCTAVLELLGGYETVDVKS